MVDTCCMRRSGPIRKIVSNGSCLRWTKNGRELLYLNSTRKLMVMPVDIARGVLRTGSPQPLFDVPYENNYFATADGSRFLIRAPIDATVGSPPVEVLTDWSALVRTTGSL